MHDIVIRGGEVADGTGSAPVRADVAIDGDRVTAVGAIEDRGRREIDADGSSPARPSRRRRRSWDR